MEKSTIVVFVFIVVIIIGPAVFELASIVAGENFKTENPKIWEQKVSQFNTLEEGDIVQVDEYSFLVVSHTFKQQSGGCVVGLFIQTGKPGMLHAHNAWRYEFGLKEDPGSYERMVKEIIFAHVAPYASSEVQKNMLSAIGLRHSDD